MNELSRRNLLARVAKCSLGVTIGGSAATWLSTANAANESTGTAKNIIYLFLSGGLSHIDSFDPKPEAPVEYRGPIKAISTNVDGIQLGHHFTKLAKQTDKLTLIRSMVSTQGAHYPGYYHMRTGYKPRPSIKHPAMGAWAQKLDPSRMGTSLPSYVAINAKNGHPGAGFFEPAYSPFPIGDAEAGLPHAQRPPRLSEQMLNEQVKLRQELDHDFNQTYQSGYRNIRGYNEMFDSALKLMKSKDLAAFDISKEPPAAAALYGSSEFGKGALLARRLVEHGARFVEVEMTGFDWHSNNFTNADELLPIVDQVLAALLQDLHGKGMLEQTMVVVATEFGRSPKIAKSSGRGHFPAAFSYVVAGGGIKGGTVYGETDRLGEYVVSGDTTAADFNATIGYAMGLPYDKVMMSPSGRPFQMNGEDAGVPIKEIFS